MKLVREQGRKVEYWNSFKGNKAPTGEQTECSRACWRDAKEKAVACLEVGFLRPRDRSETTATPPPY